ncbi:MAG TPA: hypothetical protein VHZ97_12090 [Pseudonocardiaceae bacterium]|jgi:uncharacterized protein YukE|nr:hypothetical protein [Pseudonocardiaceae bacterium]
MSGISVNQSWITSYANTVAQAASELAKASQPLQATPLTAASFGSIGNEVQAGSAYNQVAQTLEQQLSRAAAALQAAAMNLRSVVGAHAAADEQQAAAFRAVGPS